MNPLGLAFPTVLPLISASREQVSAKRYVLRHISPTPQRSCASNVLRDVINAMGQIVPVALLVIDMFLGGIHAQNNAALKSPSFSVAIVFLLVHLARSC
jgi:hypothetical protein